MPLANMALASSSATHHASRIGRRHSNCVPKRFACKPWQGLHFKKLSALVVMLVRVEFLNPDGKPRYKRPMWLFWTGPLTVSLQDLCKMYLWRFAIEHMFRFLKQHMGLNASRSNDLVSTEQWMWLCALAYWQLLLMRGNRGRCPPGPGSPAFGMANRKN